MIIELFLYRNGRDLAEGGEIDRGARVTNPDGGPAGLGRGDDRLEMGRLPGQPNSDKYAGE